MARQREAMGQPVVAQPVMAQPNPIRASMPSKPLNQNHHPSLPREWLETPDQVLVEEPVMLAEAEPAVAVEPEPQPEEVEAMADAGTSTTAEPVVQAEQEVAKKRGFWDWLSGQCGCRQPAFLPNHIPLPR